MLLLTPYLIRSGESAVVFGFALYSISAYYFILEAIVGIVFILSSPESYQVALIVQLLIAALYVVFLVPNMLANEHSVDKEEKRRIEIDCIKKATLEVSSILNSVTDTGLRKKVEKVFDALKSSQIKSHPDAAGIESNILISIGELKEALKTDDENFITRKIDSLLASVSERNSRLKALN
jgi:hypothetical protein